MNGQYLPETLYFAKAEHGMEFLSTYHKVNKEELADFLEEALADTYTNLTRITEREYQEATS